MNRAALPRPRRAALPVAVVSVVVALWAVVGHDTGLGWVQAVGAFVAGGLVVGLLAPAVATARVRVGVVASPADALAGAPSSLEVSVRGCAELEPLDPPGPRTLSGGAPTATLTVRPAQRGVVEHCVITVASAAPFGLLWWTKTVELALPRPMAVAPRVGRADDSLCRAGDEPEPPSVTPGRGDDPRGVRPYERGDRRALVHWPATAHAGALMVRETERLSGRLVAVSGLLPDDLDEADRQAERVMGTVAGLLATGARVELATTEPAGQTSSVVTTVEAAGRRLALALPHRPPSPGPARAAGVAAPRATGADG